MSNHANTRNHNIWYSPRPSAGVLSTTQSRFWLIDCPGRTTTCAQAIGKTTLPTNVVFDDKNLSRIELLQVQFLCNISLKQKRTVLTDMNEKTPESHECKCQLRLQKQREQRRARLALETKEQRERRLQLQHTARKRREQSRLAEQTSEEAQKRLKAERQQGASRLQCQTAEQTACTLLDQSKWR